MRERTVYRAVRRPEVSNLYLIKFNNHKFEGEEKIDNYAEKYLYSELPGILAWAVRGYLKMQEEGLNPPDIVLNATRDYKKAEDAVGAFLDEYCIIDNEADVSVTEIFGAFKTQDDSGMKKKDFDHYLENRGHKRFRKSGFNRNSCKRKRI